MYADVTSDIVLPHGVAAQTVIRLTWRRADPLAVGIDLSSRPEHPALPSGEWVVLRDFLRYGMEEPTGDGIVRISPDPAGVQLQLVSPVRSVLCTVPADRLRAFLDATEQMVPSGAEVADGDLDDLVLRLLMRADPDSR